MRGDEAFGLTFFSLLRPHKDMQGGYPHMTFSFFLCSSLSRTDQLHRLFGNQHTMVEDTKGISGFISPISNITISNFGAASVLVNSNHTVHTPSLSKMSLFNKSPAIKDGHVSIRQRSYGGRGKNDVNAPAVSLGNQTRKRLS